MAKGKGSNFERELCRMFSLWWSLGARDDIYWRSAGSGAMAKTRSKSGKQTFGQYGDMQATDPSGQPLLDLCVVEFKRGYSGCTFADSLDKPAKAAVQQWEKFVLQVMADRENAKTPFWMLVTRRDRREAMIFMPLTLMKEFRDLGARTEGWVRARIRIDSEMVQIGGCLLSQFLDKASPEMVKKILVKFRHFG